MSILKKFEEMDEFDSLWPFRSRVWILKNKKEARNTVVVKPLF